MGRKGNLWLAGALSLSPSVSWALGLGELTLQSYLNEPLRAEVDLLEVGGLDEGQVKIRLAAREDFDRAGVERAYFLTSLTFTVEVDGPDKGRLVITSKEPVREPYLDFLVEARWPNGRLLREYTVLLDLPVLAGEGSNMVVAQRKSGAGSDTATSAVEQEEVSPEPEPESPPRAEPSYGADAQERPQSGEEYLVRRNETLWAIASRARPEGATVQETMLDIQRLNPDAFIGNNINQLKAGYVLVLPARDQISDRAPAEVAAAITRQEQSWLENRASQGEQAAARRSGWTSEADEQGRLQIDVNEDGGASSLAGDVSARMEDADRASRDNADIRNQIASMQQQLQTLQSLVTLKDDQIAALQSRLAEQGQADDSAAPVLEGTIDDMGGTGDMADMSAAGDTGVDTDSATETDDATGAEAPAEVTVAAPAPAPAPAAQSSGGLMTTIMDNLLYVGLAILALLLAVVYAVRRRAGGADGDSRQADNDDEFANVKLGDDGLIVDDPADESDADSAERGGAFGDSGDGAYAAQFESGDALAEADIYIAYGRYPQAVELLKNAIAAEPTNIEYRLKLMEASVEMVDQEGFQQQYADLEAMGDGAALQRARDLLQAVDGGESWLSGLPAASLSEADVALAASPFEDEDADLGIDFSSDTDSQDDDSLNLDLDDDSLEFDDLDLGDAPVPGSEPLAAGDDLELEPEPQDEAADLVAEQPAAEEGLDLASMAADLKDNEETPAAAADDELDLLSAAQQLGDEEPAASAPVDLLDDDPDLGGDDSELMTEFGALEIEEPGSEDTLPEYTADDGLGFSAEGEEMATRMDLARAYIDMGDAEGAREILTEVIASGDAGQQEEARSLLASIE